jgi:predicted ATPase/DNA-binding winged helix-turn-helix (wHTH) protein
MNDTPKLCFGPYLLDEANECLRRDDEAIPLRPKAYGVLRYLLSHPGVLVTKQQLLDAVWPDTFVGDSVLKDSIRQLREALGDEAKSPQFIETRHRRGYRFIAPLREAPSRNAPSNTSVSSRFSAYVIPNEERVTSEMLGRDENLAQLHSSLKKALGGQRQTVFVTGEAGIGKTTLVEAFLKDLTDNMEILIGRGQCLEQYGSGEAYLPVLDAFSKLARDSLSEIVVEKLRLFAPSWLVQMPGLLTLRELDSFREQTTQTTRERMLREMTETIEAISTKRPFILFLDDLHWSDYSTVDLISYLARRSQPASFMLIGTYRPVDVALNEHPLKGTKQDLLIHKFCSDLPLEYLSEGSVATFLNTRFPSNSFPSRLAEMIHRHTEGNPLFMVNVVDYLIDRELILESDGQYHLAVSPDEIELGVPENIRELIEDQVERLSEEEQRILEGASVVGMDCSAVAIAAGLNSDVIKVEEICDGLARRNHFLLPAYLAELPDGTITPRYRFIHATYLDVLYRRVAPTRRSQIHWRIGERGEAIYGDMVGVIAAELAVHFEEAHDLARAVKYLELAAENAESRSANHEALSLARRGLDLISTMPISAEGAIHKEKFANRISALEGI